MNLQQKIVLCIFVLVTAGMLMYPPFQITIRATETNMGYGFLFDPPKRGSLAASVNVAVLLAQWLVAALVSGVIWLLVKENGNPTSAEKRQRDPQNKSLFESTMFGVLRIIRGIIGFVFGWQIVGLFPVITWFSNPSAITGGMVGLVLVKVFMAIVFGLLFFGSRTFIHWLHGRWYRTPHPALTKTFAL